MDILEIFLQFLKGLALGLVVGIFFQIPKPHLIVLPINISNGIHIFRILNRHVICNFLSLLSNDAGEPTP